MQSIVAILKSAMYVSQRKDAKLGAVELAEGHIRWEAASCITQSLWATQDDVNGCPMVKHHTCDKGLPQARDGRRSKQLGARSLKKGLLRRELLRRAVLDGGLYEISGSGEAYRKEGESLLLFHITLLLKSRMEVMTRETNPLWTFRAVLPQTISVHWPSKLVYTVRHCAENKGACAACRKFPASAYWLWTASAHAQGF